MRCLEGGGPIHETAKIGADNPDNYYQHASLSGQYDYVIRGHRGTHRYELADFGLDPIELVARFKSYRERFDVPRESE